MMPYCNDEWENRLAIFGTATMLMASALACVVVTAGTVVVSVWCLRHW